jgi:predicted nucleotidyltransferase component of viral defense system
MSVGHTRDSAASIKQKLLNLARQERVNFNLLQIRYATERLLYRLSVSPFEKDFFLKGAMLFVMWENNPHRPTKDIDLLFLPDLDRPGIEQVFRKVAALAVPDDGLAFEAESVRASDIREENAYGGLRVKLNVTFGSGRIPLQIDIGRGDVVYPEPKWAEFPSILGLPTPRIRPYPIDSVVAEKFQAVVELKDRNSRMKDYYDLLYLPRKFEFVGDDLLKAVQLTFRRRRTPLPNELPDGLSELFWGNDRKQAQRNAFLRKNNLVLACNLRSATEEIGLFLMPLFNEADVANCRWSPASGWRPHG